MYAKYILISLLNKLIDFKHLNFAGKSFDVHAILYYKAHFPKLVFTRKICILYGVCILCGGYEKYY